jgi:hypothetical protein
MSLGGAVPSQVKVGQANDPHEREADQVADRVVRRQPAPDITPVPPGGPIERLSAQMIEGTRPSKTTEEKQDEKAPAPPPRRPQAQAAEQRPENKTEPAPPGPVQRQAAEENKKEETATAAPQPLPVQRRTAEDTAEGPKRAQPWFVQRQVLPAEKRGAETSTDHDAVSRAIQRSGMGGEPLEPGIRAAMESSTGRDFGGVRVHHDDSAQAAARALGARAFAHGNGIWLGRGESPGDERLMAHEATHVAQQGGAPTWNAPAPAAAPVTQGLDAEEAPVRRQTAPGTPAAAAVPPAAPPGAPPGPPVAPPADVAPGEIDLKGLPELLPEKVPQSIASYLEERQGKGKVMLRFGAIAAGPAEVSKRNDLFLIDGEALPLSHPLFARIGEVAPGLQPSLIVSIGRDRKVRGQVGIKAGKRLRGLESTLRQGPALLGLKGFAIPEVRGLTNKLEGGRLVVGATDIPIRLGKVLSGTFSFELSDGEITTLGGTVNVAAKGVVNGSISLLRAVKGGAVVVSGKASLGLNLPAHFSGSIEASWDGEAFSGVGVVGYQGEKLSGKVTLRLMEKGLADQLEAEKKAPPPEAGAAPAAAGGPAASPAAGGSPSDQAYVVFGEGDLNFAFNDWLNGTAHVIVDSKGFVTVIGKITPQKEFPLFEPKSYNKELFKLEARAAYGIPVVGNVFLFANIGLSAFAGVQGKLYKITAEGTYSTDPEKAKSFTIQGTVNISAKAGLTLRAEGGVGLEILGHDIKAGAGINATAGIRGYAEATPIIGYREKGKPGEDKKGEFFIRGDVEVAAQAFLELSGDLFVQIDSPWWSPVPDKTWTWPLFDKSWPIGGTLGAGLTVDYVFGSGQAPALEFKKVDFSADKFMDDMINDKAEKKAAEAAEQKSAWKERNEKAAEPPAGPSKPGNAQLGKAPAPPAAKPKAERGGPKKPTKGADPAARTADGKTVKQHQQEALKKGKQPDKAPGKEKLGVPEAGQKVKDALQAQLPGGAASVADVTKVLSGLAAAVAPALTNLRAEEVMPGKPKNEGAIGFKVKAKAEKGGDLLVASVRYAKAGSALGPEERWKRGVEGVKRLLKPLVKRGISEEAIRSQLPKWQAEFGFTALTLNTAQLPWVIEGDMSPGKPVTTVAPGGVDADKFGVDRDEIERRFRHRLDDTYVFALVERLWTVRRGPGQGAKTQYQLVHKGQGSYSLDALETAEEASARQAHDEVISQYSGLPRELLRGHGSYTAGHAGHSFTTATRDAVDDIGYASGDHSQPKIKVPGTSAIDPATHSGKHGKPNWIPDHQPPDVVGRGGGNVVYRFYPHSLSSASAQGGVVNGYKNKMMKKRNRGETDWAKGIQSEWFW